MEVSYSRILVPLDGSSFAEQSLPYAEYMARGLGARLILMSCVDPYILSLPSVPDMGVSYDIAVDIDAAKSERKEYLDRTQIILKQSGIDVEVILRIGSPVEEILDLVENYDIDLIVMTTHGKTGLLKLVYGSIAESVLHRSPKPVQLIRSKQRD